MRNDHFFSFVWSVPATIFTFAYGVDSQMLSALLVLMLADYITGMLASVMDDKGLSSAVGFKGLLKKFVVLIILAVTHHIDLLLGTNVVMLGALYFYGALELISITENAGRMGIPMPGIVKNAITILKERGDQHGTDLESQVHDHEISFDRTEQTTERTQDR